MFDTVASGFGFAVVPPRFATAFFVAPTAFAAFSAALFAGPGFASDCGPGFAPPTGIVGPSGSAIR
jgi:hypothetical protein